MALHQMHPSHPLPASPCPGGRVSAVCGEGQQPFCTYPTALTLEGVTDRHGFRFVPVGWSLCLWVPGCPHGSQLVLALHAASSRAAMTSRPGSGFPQNFLTSVLSPDLPIIPRQPFPFPVFPTGVSGFIPVISKSLRTNRSWSRLSDSNADISHVYTKTLRRSSAPGVG